MVDRELIALLPSDDQADEGKPPMALMRLADGRVAVERLCQDRAAVEGHKACYRRSRPIIDPASREVIGYEMEQVLMRAGA